MKGLLKNLGLILILVGAVILVACSFTGNVNVFFYCPFHPGSKPFRHQLPE